MASSPSSRTSSAGGPQLGRRERKKAQTRATIATVALELFLARGFDDVGIREVAERADVAVATVFAHFPSKEALVFDEDEEIVASLLAAVTDRAAGTSPLKALQGWFLGADPVQRQRRTSADFAQFRALVDATPALHRYWNDSWRRHAGALATALTESSSMSTQEAELLATLVIEGFLLAAGHHDMTTRLELLFSTLRDGVAHS